MLKIDESANERCLKARFQIHPYFSVYKVFRVVPTTLKEFEAIVELHRQATDLQLDFWKSPTDVGQFADIMVPPDSFEFVLHYLNKHLLDYRITVEDVQKLILQREKGDPAPSWAKPNASALSDPLLASFFRKRYMFSRFNRQSALTIVV